ncbi:hypothetical protein ACSBRB_07700 [Staphylococcus auricularis]
MVGIKARHHGTDIVLMIPQALVQALLTPKSIVFGLFFMDVACV